MYIRILEPDFVFSDDRGQLVQLVHDGYRQVNFISSHAGERRGGHYHRSNRELFYVISGSLELEVWSACENEGGSKAHYVFGSGSMFEIAENVMHSFHFIKDTNLISMYTRGVELASGEKDIIKGDGYHEAGCENICGGT